MPPTSCVEVVALPHCNIIGVTVDLNNGYWNCECIVLIHVLVDKSSYRTIGPKTSGTSHVNKLEIFANGYSTVLVSDTKYDSLVENKDEGSKITFQ